MLLGKKLLQKLLVQACKIHGEMMYGHCRLPKDLCVDEDSNQSKCRHIAEEGALLSIDMCNHLNQINI